MSNAYIGLDVAKTTGLAIIENLSKKAYTYTFKNTKKYEDAIDITVDLVCEIISFYNYQFYVHINIEEHTSFRNSVGSRTLMMYNGYFYHLLRQTYTTHLCNLNTVRKQLGIQGNNKSKKEKWYNMVNQRFDVKYDDSSDALGLALFRSGLTLDNIVSLEDTVFVNGVKREK